jgi:type 1 glutamine amidotransferase
MNWNAFMTLAVLAAALGSNSAGFAQPTPSLGQPENCPAEGFTGGFTRGCPQRQFANAADISAMMAALPDKPLFTPKSLRRVLVLGRAVGWVHTSIPLAAKMVEYLGDRTGAWMTTITYDAAAITPENLKQYDAIFLSSTTGEFLDDPNDKAVSEVRKSALLEFVKSGKGLAGVHAATDSYHTTERPGSRGGAPAAPAGTWPEFNQMIGGFFKFHWVYPTLIPVKIDDPKSPLTAMFPPRGYDIVDETYTFAQDSFSRKRVHVLTSINYAKMSAEDKAKEPAATRRTDGDYALSYIQRVGNGRVFYEAHGHDEKIYYSRPFVLHMLAGIQYALGDLAADDSPSEK